MSEKLSQVNWKHIGWGFIVGVGVFFILSLLGIVPTSFSIGPFEFGSTRASNQENSFLNDDTCAEYGIEIIEPAQGYTTEDGWVTIQGRYQKKPPQNSVKLFINALDGNLYWPTSDYVTAFPSEKTWEGSAFAANDYYILVAFTGNATRTLTNYFLKVGANTGEFIGIDELPSDVFECDRVYVRRTN